MKALTFIRYDAVTSCWLWLIQNSIRVSYHLRHRCLRRLAFLNVKVVHGLALRSLLVRFQMLLSWRYLRIVSRPTGPSSRLSSRFNKASSTIWKIQKVFESRIIGKKKLRFAGLGFLHLFITWISVKTLSVSTTQRYIHLESLFRTVIFFKTGHLFFMAPSVVAARVLNSNFKLLKRVRIFIERWHIVILIIRWQVEALRKFLMSRWRSHLVIVHRSILAGKLVASTSYSLMKKVDSWPHTIISTLRHSRMYLSLHFPWLSVAVLGIDVVQILSSIRFFLSTWWSLPLFILLKNLTVRIVDRHDRFTEPLSDKSLELVLDFGLLLLQIIWMEDGRLVLLLKFDFLIGDIFSHSWAYCSWLELVLEDLLIYWEVGWDVVLVSGSSWYSHARI